MARYVDITVKIVREFDDLDRTAWGAKYLGTYGDPDNPRYVLFDADDVKEADA